MANKRTDCKYTSHLELFKHGEYSTMVSTLACGASYLSSILGIRPKILKYRRVAQLAEQWIPNPPVVGSNPTTTCQNILLHCRLMAGRQPLELKI